MSRQQKDKSFLKYYIVISLAIHLGILILIPFDPAIVATKGFVETNGQFYDVELVQLKNEQTEVPTPGQTVSQEDEVVKPEAEIQPEQKPVEKPPIEEPKPEEKTQGIPGSEDKPIETEANIEKLPTEPQEEPNEDTTFEEQSQPLEEPQSQEQSQSTVVEPEKNLEPLPENEPVVEQQPSEPTEPEITPEEVVTNENSDEVIEIEQKPEPDIEPEPETQPIEPVSEEPASTEEESEITGTVPSTPVETGDPEPAEEPVEEKKPVLPTNALDTITQSMEPVYPKTAANEGVEGTVNLLVTVAATGEITFTEITRASGNLSLDTVALNTIKMGWKFKPYPFPYTVQVSVEFKSGDVNVTLGDLKFLE